MAGLDYLPKTLSTIFNDAGVKKAVAARIPKRLKDVVFSTLTASGVELIHGASSGEINMADAGITHADYGIAETGTIVEITANDLERLASSLPRIHIALLHVGNILPSVEALAEPIRKALQPPDSRKYITLISGPSRTSDIELRSILGVHGPHQVHVIVLGVV